MPDDDEWMVDELVGHRFIRRSIEFNVRWTAGDHTWELFQHVKDLEALDHYYALIGVTCWQQLGRRSVDPGPRLVECRRLKLTTTREDIGNG